MVVIRVVIQGKSLGPPLLVYLFMFHVLHSENNRVGILTYTLSTERHQTLDACDYHRGVVDVQRTN